MEGEQEELPVKKKKTDKEKVSKEKKETFESGNKIWVMVVLIVTVIISLFFIYKGRGVEIPSSIQQVNPTQESSPGIFGPATYEFGN